MGLIFLLKMKVLSRLLSLPLDPSRWESMLLTFRSNSITAVCTMSGFVVRHDLIMACWLLVMVLTLRVESTGLSKTAGTQVGDRRVTSGCHVIETINAVSPRWPATHSCEEQRGYLFWRSNF